MNAFSSFLKTQPSGRILAIGFLGVILLGSALLCLPCCLNPGAEIKYIDSLFISTSAVCVTGLISVDVAGTFSPLGRLVIALLIQTGGLGIASVGAGIMLMIGRRINIKGRGLLRDSLGLDSGGGMVRMLRRIFIITFVAEAAGALLCLPVFLEGRKLLPALGISAFHAVSAFNNAGFDILGGFDSLLPYSDSPLLLLTTAALIFFGGIGYFVISELIIKRFHWKKLSMHSRVVLTTSAALIVSATLLTRLTEGLTWLQSFFHSVSMRTAGFAASSMADLSSAGLLMSCVFMVIGASPGSTGGGIKTSTLFTLLQGIRSAATNSTEKAFHYSLPKFAFRKAATVAISMLMVVLTGCYLLLAMEPDLALPDALFEVCSAAGTVGLSTGITTGLTSGSKLVLCAVMFIGRLGPITIAALWHFGRGERASYPDGNIFIG